MYSQLRIPFFEVDETKDAIQTSNFFFISVPDEERRLTIEEVIYYSSGDEYVDNEELGELSAA
jgi:hypothetical protein